MQGSFPKTQHGGVQVANDKIDLKIIVLAFLQGTYVKFIYVLYMLSSFFV
jgi:hypothetical protein